MIQKMPRFDSQIQSEPPRVPVNSYHCTLLMLRAKALPSTSQGHDICACTMYQRSQAIQKNIRNRYGRMPPKRFLDSRKKPKMTDICREFASTAKMPPPIAANSG